MNYRLVSARKKITYREQLEDVGKAVDKFREIAPDAHLTPDNLIVLGESSGGHLALLYGYKHPDKIKKIISLSGPTDFYSAAFLKTFYSRYTSPTFQDVVGEKFDRNHISEKFKDASPLANVTNIPTLHFQGSADFLVNRNQGKELDSALTAHNVPHTFIYMKNAGHIPRFLNRKLRKNVIFPAILKFIKED